MSSQIGYYLSLLLLFLLSCQTNDQVVVSEMTPPNLILIIADDMAWDDCGAYGHPSIKTPNLDQLATDGMRFNNAFLTTSSCSPSRSSIITGTYPHQTDAEQLHWPLPGDKITFVEKLKAAGYWTAQAGKWHLGDTIKDRFDYLAPTGTSGFVLGANDTLSTKTKDDGSGCQQWLPTLKKRPANQPFFLWLAALDPHRPYITTEETIHQLDDVKIPPYLPDTEVVRADFVAYYEEITRMDRYIGEIIAELDRTGLSDNTFILFISDNGRPFPRDKTTLYDSGIKTPWIVKWPNRIPKGGQTDALVSSVDIAPTFLSLAGIETSDSPWEGYDFSPIFNNPDTIIRDYIYAEDHWHDFEDYTRAVRTKDFKYIRNFYPELPNTPPADALRSPTFQTMLSLRKKNQLSESQLTCFGPRPLEELYESASDPHELKNLAADTSYFEVLVQMRQYLSTIRTSTGDQLPLKKTADEFDRTTGQPLPARKRPRASKAEMGMMGSE